MNDATPFDPAAHGWKSRTFEGFFGLVGPLWTKKEGEGWAYGFLAEPRHANGAGVVHGGMLATMLDHALSIVGWEAQGRKRCVTIQLDTHFLGAVMPGQFVEARGRIVKSTRSLVFVQGSLWVADEEVATATAVLKVLEAR
jgi:uncharacterized protein (TIGR00369 family)